MLLELEERGEPATRFNTEDFPVRSGMVLSLCRGRVGGSIEAGGRAVGLDEIRSVWYRRPAEPEPSKEVEDPDDRWFAAEESEEALFGLWRVLDCTWVSHPDALNAASYKPAQLLAASGVGLEVPRTLISNEPEEAAAFVDDLGGPAVIKPLRFGVVKETEDYEDVVFTSPLREADLATGMEAVALCPCLLQEYVRKDVEVRATVIGREVFAAEIHSQVTPGAEHDWRRASADEVPHMPHKLPAGVADRCLKLVERLGLNFGAIDLIRTPEGRYVFLEINPNGQWLWIELLTGLPITDSLVRLLAGQAGGLR